MRDQIDRTGIRRPLVVAIAIAGVVGAVLGVPMTTHDLVPDAGGAGRLRIAVLGDSDSHAYQDRLTFPAGTPDRGGPYRAATLQWTEVLARLRGDRVDLGPWGAWGVPPPLARAIRVLGIEQRTPRKQDFAYNFAVSGAGCPQLNGGWQRQVPALLTMVERSPETWAGAIVVIRIGINSIGRKEHLDRFAAAPGTVDALAPIDDCLREIERAVDALRAAQPNLGIVLVGIADNMDWPPYLDHWRSAVEVAGIHAANDRYDDGLGRIARQRPRIAFLDERRWFAAHWGGRAADGSPAYRKVDISPGHVVRNTQGDAPELAILADGHAGTALNALWLRELVPLLNALAGTAIDPPTDDEVAALLDAAAALGRRTASPSSE